MFEPKNLDDYLDLVDQAIYEADELVACAGDEGAYEDMELTELLPVYDALAKELKQLHAEIRSGRHHFADGKNLSFVPLVERWRARIPFADILAQLNESHMRGFPGAP